MFLIPKIRSRAIRPLGQAGNYRVVFTLSRPGFSLLPDHSYADAASMQGDSHLAIAKPAHPHPNLPENTHVKVTSDIAGNEITFNCYPNEKGFLGKVELPSIEAQSFGVCPLGRSTVKSGVRVEGRASMSSLRCDITN